MPLLQNGDIVRDTYEVERFLGEGAFAEVYRVRHRYLGRQAMKVFKRVGMTQAELQEALSEAVLLSRIGHPNIVRVFDANVLETPHGLCGYFTMENVPGGSLERFWQSYGVDFVPVATSVDIMRQVCRGMAVAHAEEPPLIHRDIKPQNILVGYEANGLRARVSDFGLAKQVNPLTLLASAAGTIAFKAPETIANLKADSCAADVWSLGVTLYLLLTDRLPFEIDPDLGRPSRGAFKKPIISASSLNIEVDSRLDRIVETCLQVNPRERYPSAADLLQALEAWGRSSLDDHRPSDKTAISEPSKAALGAHSSLNDEEGQASARIALRMAKEQGRLLEAADLMEEAFNKSPSLRQRYAEQVRLWRCGISM